MFVLGVTLIFAVGAIIWWLITGVWFRRPEPRMQRVAVNDASHKRR